MERRERIDSPEKYGEEMVVNLPQPPAHVKLEAEAAPYWESVVGEFSREEWTTHQLEIAAFLARAMWQCGEQQRKLVEEGSVIHNAKGFNYANPREGVVNRQTNAILSLRRSLCLNARAKGGETREVQKRRSAAKSARETAVAIADEGDLIPMHNIQ